ncbi:MAG: hypothetical protein IPI83_13575 [Sphingomonadales bacterium]|nr:hypothetical protein [Sphingomonadales bacterium]
MILAIRALEVANVEIRRPENNSYQLQGITDGEFYPSKEQSMSTEIQRHFLAAASMPC